MSTTAVTNATYQSILQSTEQITFIPGAQPANVTHSETSLSAQNLGSSSTPPVKKVSVFVETLTAGAATIDLYAGLTDGGGNTITPTGLSVRAIKVQNPNPQALAITPDSGSNPYPITVTVPPYSEIAVYDTGAGGSDPAGTLGDTSGPWVKSTKTLTPTAAPGWTANALVGKVFIVNGVALACASNTTTAAVMTADGSVNDGTYTWSVVTRGNPIITATCRNLTLTGSATQGFNFTVWLG